jgi:hypothetical protein
MFDLEGLLACCLGFGVLFGGVLSLSIYQATVGAKKRKLQYLTSQVTIEGHGVKRGLTSVEAAVLLEQPIDKDHDHDPVFHHQKGRGIVLPAANRSPSKWKSPCPKSCTRMKWNSYEAMGETRKKERTKKLQEVMVNLITGHHQQNEGLQPQRDHRLL